MIYVGYKIENSFQSEVEFSLCVGFELLQSCYHNSELQIDAEDKMKVS